MDPTDNHPGEPVLAGIRVLDFTAMMAGPCCARWLSDLGAEVIKVEPPEGDHMRTRAPVRDGWSAYYGHMNAGKRCIALDLKQAAGVALALQLAEQCDVVLEAYRPGVMERLGLGSQALRTRNRRLIVCSISGFGQGNSVSHYPAYAPVIHAASGFSMADFSYQDAASRPPNAGIPLADMLTAIFAAFSIQSALLKRERTGQGATIDVNLMDSMMNVLTFEFQQAQFPQRARRPLYKPLKALDGFVLVAPVNEKNFRSVCKATGHPEWLDDVLLRTDQARAENWSEYMRRIEAWTSVRPAAECERILMAEGVPCSRYRTIDEALQDGQFEERRSFAEIEDAAGKYRTTKLPFTFDGARPAVGRRIAAVGEDTVAVLSSMLGLDATEIDALVRNGTVVAA